jgi:hypothetical protein
MQNLTNGQTVVSNPNYFCCENGDFQDMDFVICKLKSNDDCIVMFLAYQINNSDNESSN